MELIYLLIVYDVGVERVTKVMKLLRQYLNHVQNSVFEGEVYESTLMKIKNKLNKIIDKEKDSVIIYYIQKESLIKKEIVGLEKRETDRVI